MKIIEQPGGGDGKRADGAAALETLAGMVCDWLHARAGDGNVPRPEIDRARALVRAWARGGGPHPQ